MASPEVFGMSSGSLLGVIMLLFLVPLADEGMELTAAAAGLLVCF